MGSYRRAWKPSPAAIATSRRGVRTIRLRLARQSGAPDREDPGNDPPRCGKCAVTINGRLDGATHSPVPRMWMIGWCHPLSGTKDVDGPFRPSKEMWMAPFDSARPATEPAAQYAAGREYRRGDDCVQAHGMRDLTMRVLASGHFPDPAFESSPAGKVRLGILREANTLVLSDPGKIVGDPAMRAIIALGEDVV